MDRTYPQVLKKLHFDMHTPGSVPNLASAFDVDAYVDAIKRSGTQSVTLFARCAYGFYYFKTENFPMHPGLNGRDLFGEICTALRKEHIDVTAYFEITTMSDYNVRGTPKEHWIGEREDGAPQSKTWQTDLIHTPCLTKGFFEEEALPAIIECAEKYDINAVWLDGFYSCLDEPCSCSHCEAIFNKEVPEAKGQFSGHPRDRWYTKKLWDFLNKVAEELDRIKPGCTVGSDLVGCLHWSVPLPEKAAFVTYDPPTPNLAHDISLALSYTAWRGIAADMNIQRMRNWQDFNSRAPEMMFTDAAICAAMNCMLIVGDVIDPITVRPSTNSMKLVADTFAYGEAIHEKVKDIPSFAQVAIISSPEDSRACPTWRVDSPKFDAAYQIVMAAGLSAHILFDDDIAAHISKYQVVILPELSYIGTDAARALQQYVENGGQLIVVGNVPATVDPYAPTETASLEMMQTLCGVTIEGIQEAPLSFIALENTAAERYFGNYIVTPLSIPGNVTLAKPTTATTEVYLHECGTTYQIGGIPMGKQTEYPAISLHTVGKGSVTYLPQPFFSAYYELGNHLIKRLIGGILLDHITPYAKLSGASNCQMVVAKDENKLAVSAILYHGDFRGTLPRIIDGVGAMAGICVEIAEDRIPTSATSVLGDAVTYTQKDGRIFVEFPPFKIYSGIVFTF